MSLKFYFEEKLWGDTNDKLDLMSYNIHLSHVISAFEGLFQLQFQYNANGGWWYDGSYLSKSEQEKLLRLQSFVFSILNLFFSSDTVS